MAERFGGRYSPGGAPGQGAPARDPWRNRRPASFGARVQLLFIAPLPLAVRAFMLEPFGMALALSGLALLLLAAWLTRAGVVAQDAYDARRVARRPAIPRKLFGSVLTGLGLFAASYVDGGTLNAVLIGAVGALLHVASFGPDPMRDKGMEGVDTFQQDRVARAVGEAEKHLSAMSDAIRRAGDRKLERRVEAFQTAVRDMFRTVEEDPRDLTAARRYLTVYLMGARDATIKFADIYARTGDAEARADFEALLDDLEANFNARTEALLNDDRTDLDIEIEVLRDRLEREGVRAPKPRNGETQ